MTTNAEIAPELEYLLANSGNDEIAEVSLLLRNPADPQALLARLGLAENPAIVTSFVERVRVLSVRASVAVIKQLITQPEIEMATAALDDE
jgi:hypothetical protein